MCAASTVEHGDCGAGSTQPPPRLTADLERRSHLNRGFRASLGVARVGATTDHLEITRHAGDRYGALI
jgi:hypothetical protein